MKYLVITILLCVFALITRAQLNPYAISDRQADSLHAVQAQTGNDSVKMEIDAIFSMYYADINRDSAIYFLNRQLALATKLNISLWKGEALGYLGVEYSWTGNYSKALQSLNAALDIAGNEASEKNTYCPKFMIRLPAWFTSRLCLLSVIHNNIGSLYDYTGNFDKALAGHNEAIRMAGKNGDTESLAIYYSSLGSTYWNKDQLDSAFIMQQKAIAFSKKAHWLYYTGGIYETIGRMYLSTGNTTDALNYLRQSVTINHQQQNLIQEADAYNYLSLVFLNMHQPDSVIAYSKKTGAIFSRAKSETGKAGRYYLLSSAYQMKGNMDSAYAYLLLSKKINDSLVDADREQSKQYQVMNFNAQLRTQERENERNQQQSRLITYITLAGLGVTFLILFLLYRNNRQKQKTNRALTAVRNLQDKKISQLDEAVTKRTEQLNSFRQVMATDFHDQTGNMLSAISRQAMMLKLKLNGSNAEVLPVVESIITNSNDLYDCSKDFLWNLNHNSDDPLEVFQYLVNYGQVFFNQFNIPFSSSIKGIVQPLQQLDSFAALNLIYIFKEGMTNVVKHADAGEVVIEMEYSNAKIVYALQDNGRWKPKDEATSHYGLNNIERRCERNHFGFLLSRKEEGTRIEISIPVTIDFIS